MATAIRSLSQKPGAPSFAHPSQEKNPDPWRVGFIFRISFDFTVHDNISRRLSLSLRPLPNMCPILSLPGGLLTVGAPTVLSPGFCLGSPVLSAACTLCGQPSPPMALQVPADQHLHTDFYLQADLSAELWSHRINH